MSTVLRQYYSLYVLHTCMRESEKQRGKIVIVIVIVIMNASEYNLK